jgi:hypothetical protein
VQGKKGATSGALFVFGSRDSAPSLNGLEECLGYRHGQVNWDGHARPIQKLPGAMGTLKTGVVAGSRAAGADRELTIEESGSSREQWPSLLGL